MRLLLVGITLMGAFGGPVFSQDTPAKPKTINQTCTFEDRKEISVRYERASAQRRDVPLGGLFAPGSSPILLFTQTMLSIGNVEIPVGAFSLYVVTDKEKWTLIINKNVTAGSPYDEKQDLVRVLMQSGKTDTLAKQVQIRFVHFAPKQCNMRIYYGHTGAWAEFKEK